VLPCECGVGMHVQACCLLMHTLLFVQGGCGRRLCAVVVGQVHSTDLEQEVSGMLLRAWLYVNRGRVPELSRQSRSGS
jgi:hypothetical protein